MQDEKCVMALGFFDGIHIGHGALLTKARQRAQELGAEPAVLTFDIHPDTFVKHTAVPLINSAADRSYIVRRWYDIDTVRYIHFNEETMRLPWREFLEDVRMAYGVVHFVVGHDFSFGFKGEGTPALLQSWCAEVGIGCDVIPAVEKDGIVVSSTYIRSLLDDGDIDRANAFLGHPHILSDTVHTGFRIGRTLDYPTVNMQFASGVLIPKHGVYISRVLLPDGSDRCGITNIGVRPTFDGERLTVETHIFDFDADLYGERLTLEFHRFLRPERRFSSPEVLRAQISSDAVQARQFFNA